MLSAGEWETACVRVEDASIETDLARNRIVTYMYNLAAPEQDYNGLSWIKYSMEPYPCPQSVDFPPGTPEPVYARELVFLLRNDWDEIGCVDHSLGCQHMR